MVTLLEFLASIALFIGYFVIFILASVMIIHLVYYIIAVIFFDAPAISVYEDVRYSGFKQGDIVLWHGIDGKGYMEHGKLLMIERHGGPFEGDRFGMSVIFSSKAEQDKHHKKWQGWGGLYDACRLDELELAQKKDAKKVMRALKCNFKKEDVQGKYERWQQRLKEFKRHGED